MSGDRTLPQLMCYATVYLPIWRALDVSQCAWCRALGVLRCSITPALMGGQVGLPRRHSAVYLYKQVDCFVDIPHICGQKLVSEF